MNNYQLRKIDQDFIVFAKRHYEKPKNCKNLDQTRFYIDELRSKIEEMKAAWNYVPEYAYTLLSEYNGIQNKILFEEFKNAY